VSTLFQEQLKLCTAIVGIVKKQIRRDCQNIYTRCIIILILNTSNEVQVGVLSHNNSEYDENANRQQAGSAISKPKVLCKG
jgi:hypothetical protein